VLSQSLYSNLIDLDPDNKYNNNIGESLNGATVIYDSIDENSEIIESI
jgi:hypothetical protein